LFFVIFQARRRQRASLRRNLGGYDSYDNYVKKYLPLPLPTLDGVRTILPELSSAVPAAKNADPEQFVSYNIAGEIEASGFIKRLYEK
jgi:hypothetical protein